MLSRGAGTGGSGRGSAPGDDGAWVCPLCPSCLPPTLTSVTSAIYSEVYFLYQMPSPARQELMGAHWERRPCSSALSACSVDTNHFSMVGQDPPAPQPSPQVQLWCCQHCSAGREQGHASHPGVGWGHGWWYFVLFFGNAPRGCPTAAGAGRGDYFLSGQKVACQMRVRLITLFLKKLFKCQH